MIFFGDFSWFLKFFWSFRVLNVIKNGGVLVLKNVRDFVAEPWNTKQFFCYE
jgi:hypothetical protein